VSGRRLAPITLTLAVAAIAIVILTSGPSTHTVTAEFSDVRGLVSGAQVRLAGVPVGSVTRIWLGPDGWPRVQMSIDDGVSIGTTGSAAVRLASLSGEFNDYVSVVQGDGPPVSFIPSSHTTSPVAVDEALSALDPSTEASLRTILGGLRTTLSGEGSALAATLSQSQAALAEVGGLANDVGGDGAELQLALEASHTIASTLSSQTPQLGTAVDEASSLLHTVAGRAAAVSSALAGLPAGLEAANSTLTRGRQLIGPADQLVAVAVPAVSQLPAVSDELRDALGAAKPTLARAADVAASAPGAAVAMTPLLRAARPLLNTMIPVLRGLGPMLDQARVRLPDLFSFFSNWADFTSNYDANGHGARVGIVLPPAPTNVLSPSSNGGGQLAPPYLRTPGSLEGDPWTDYWKSFVAGGKPGPDVSGK
jgi:phospholipid/cholesterol/gamma-HCH transport system substrate-binding protein